VDAGSFGYRRAMVRAGFALDDLTGHVQYSDRDQDGYYFLSRTYSKTLSGNLKYALTASSDLSLGFDCYEEQDVLVEK
jgi:iron complex outermembrane receptor protein